MRDNMFIVLNRIITERLAGPGFDYTDSGKRRKIALVASRIVSLTADDNNPNQTLVRYEVTNDDCDLYLVEESFDEIMQAFGLVQS